MADVGANCQYLGERERAVLRHDLLQRPARDEFHPQGDVVARQLRAEHSHDVRVVHLGEQPSLVQRGLSAARHNLER